MDLNTVVNLAGSIIVASRYIPECLERLEKHISDRLNKRFFEDAVPETKPETKIVSKIRATRTNSEYCYTCKSKVFSWGECFVCKTIVCSSCYVNNLYYVDPAGNIDSEAKTCPICKLRIKKWCDMFADITFEGDRVYHASLKKLRKDGSIELMFDNSKKLHVLSSDGFVTPSIGMYERLNDIEVHKKMYSISCSYIKITKKSW